MAVEFRVHEPGRHLLGDDSGLDRLGPGARLLVGQQRHGGDFAWPMALLAVLLEDGKNVFIEGDRGIRSSQGRDRGQRTSQT